MRIISGIYKGKRLYPGKNFRARPTTDFAKENLFNVIANYFDFGGLHVLDLFSGTGSIAYEFASRGSMSVDSVEINSKYHAFIHRTSKELQFDQVTAIRTDAFRFLKHTDREYDIIFADPPFDLNDIDQIPHIVFSRNLLKPGGWFILEHGKDHDFSLLPQFRELRKYGSVHFSVFENK
ncbi:MAG: methyltransferase domain-containing protein [Marinilabiliales bacterium]|nr:MAG: methyltransferase domain-containing protein [Marinilabiliales bacterium]